MLKKRVSLVKHLNVKCQVLEEDMQDWPSSAKVEGQCPGYIWMHWIHPLGRCHCQEIEECPCCVWHLLHWRMVGMFHMDSTNSNTT